MEQDLSKYIGTKLKIYRLQNKLTQGELASSIGTTKATISNYETGYRTPQQDTLFQLANVLNVKIDDFFPERQSPSSNIEKTNLIMKKLDDARREVVYKCAEEQLEEQQKEKIVSMPKKQEARDFAAHSDDPNKKVTEEEKERIHDFLDYLDEKHDKNK